MNDDQTLLARGSLGGATSYPVPWQFLVLRPHRWRQQYSIKGRNMTVGQLVSTIRANGYTPETASAQLDLPIQAINEALNYYAKYKVLIEMETTEERRRATERGIPLEPENLLR